MLLLLLLKNLNDNAAPACLLLKDGYYLLYLQPDLLLHTCQTSGNHRALVVVVIVSGQGCVHVLGGVVKG